LKSRCVLQDHYEDERDMFHNKTPDLQDQDHSVQDQDRSFWSRTGFVLRSTDGLRPHHWYFGNVPCTKWLTHM